MKLGKKNSKATAADAEVTEPQPAKKSLQGESVAQTQTWTNGSALGSRATTIGLVVLIACGPIGLGVAMASRGDSTAASTTAEVKPVSALEQSAGSFAVGFVGSWLGATQDDSSALSGYTSVNLTVLSKAPFQYRNAVVASVTPANKQHLVQVVVAVDVKDETISKDGADQWPRRYYQVTISADQDRLVAVGLPAPVAGPARESSTPNLAYNEGFTTASSAGKAVTSFLAAYLTGQGATEPYTAPSTSLPAIQPAPYSELAVVAMQGDVAPTESPADDDTVNVYATVTAGNSVGQQVTATYTLTLRARADRWEVSRIGTVPALTDTTTSTVPPVNNAPQPSPTGDATTEGN